MQAPLENKYESLKMNSVSQDSGYFFGDPCNKDYVYGVLGFGYSIWESTLRPPYIQPDLVHSPSIPPRGLPYSWFYSSPPEDM